MPDLDLQTTALMRLPDIRTGSVWGFWWELAWQDNATGTETVMDLTGAEAVLGFRRRAGDAPLLSVSVGTGLAIDLVLGRVRAALSSAQTAAMPVGEVLWALSIRLPGGDWWEAFAGVVPIVAGGRLP
jgi:hypothetical protein